MVYSRHAWIHHLALSRRRSLLFIALLAFLSFWILWPFLTPIAWALILWRLFSGPHERVASVVQGGRAVSAMMMTLGVMTLIVLPFSYTSAVAASELMHLYEVGKKWMGAGGLNELPERVAQLPLVGSVSQDRGAYSGGSVPRLPLTQEQGKPLRTLAPGIFDLPRGRAPIVPAAPLGIA